MSSAHLGHDRAVSASKPRRGWLGFMAAALVTAGVGTLANEAVATAGPMNLGATYGAIVVANSLGSTITSYSPGSAGDAAPNYTLLVGLNVPDALAFGSSGDLWVANFGDHTVAEFLENDLGRASAAPAVTISSDAAGSLNSPAGLAFDPQGDLWVTNDLSNTLVEYPRASLANGPLVPAVTISSDPSRSLSGPLPLAFDSLGDLWVGNYDTSTVVEYAKASLAATGDPAPAVTISPDGSGRLNSPAGLAFDASGDLWVAANLSDKLLEYTRSELATGAVSPAVTISANAWASLDSPEGLAFDRSGNLWVANYGNSSVAEFSPSELTTSGDWPPRVIAGPRTLLWAPSYVAIGPASGAPAPEAPLASASVKTLDAKTGLARVEVSCEAGRCAGSIEVVSKRPAVTGHGKHAPAQDKATVLGSVNYSLARGRAGRFDVRLGTKAKATLAELRSYRLGLEVVITVRGGRTVTQTWQ